MLTGDGGHNIYADTAIMIRVKGTKKGAMMKTDRQRKIYKTKQSWFDIT